MAESMSAALPQVALIFGDADAVKHVREALGGHVAIVYDAQAAAFDAAQLAASGARAALVNLDSYDWLDTLTAQLSNAGVDAVFNDPEISAQLDGWERARWLRHLVAKLRGSDDFDPPRPALSGEHVSAPATFTPAAASVATLVSEAPAASAPVAAAGEQPLSSREIASLTADFSGVAAAPAIAPTAATPAIVAGAPRAEAKVAAEPPHLVTAPLAADDFDPALDVDTEALSAMIDARLAEPEDHMQPVIADDLSASAPNSVMSPAAPEPAAPAVEATPEPIAAAAPASPPSDDSDVLADLPAIGDWELVDPEAPIATAPKAAKASVPNLADGLAGIELVPMDNDVPIELHTEPIEHRLVVERRTKAGAANDNTAGSAHGDHA